MDSLVAAAIHDAKNSLNALGVWLAEAEREYAKKAGGASSPALLQANAITARLSGQLVELLALYRAGQGRLHMAIGDHNLTDFLTDLMAELECTNPNRHSNGEAIRIRIDTDVAVAHEIGDWAFDAYLVKFALLDALRNAVRHAKQRVLIRLAWNPASDAGAGRRLCFSVEDDGQGFPEDVLQRVHVSDAMLDPNTDTDTAMSMTSSGLGLSFAQLIASRHVALSGSRGALELANDGLGLGGARFSLLLP